MSTAKISKEKMIIQFTVFMWIVLCNLVVQSFLEPLHEIGFTNWSFFLANILFFLLEDPSYKDRFLKVLFGSLVGLIGAYLLAIIYTILVENGVSHLFSVMIPLTIVLFLIINLHPILPKVFNNIGFAFFTIALIDAAGAYSHITGYIVSAVAGNLIVNGVAVLIIIELMKYFTKHPLTKSEKTKGIIKGTV
ncbi:hypothetical protein [Bacillus sp. FJAT-29814]|uniref:hypothetical protein n=1 Tax=Bacillus sp. FJAT-29814 TaxID=1729688 RepID=UPI000830813A|nr:hypothetical protein [Bacillus sp. FJAT-29814]